MPATQTVGTNSPVKLLQPGIPGYAFGSRLSPSFKFAITSVAVASDVVTIAVLMLQGLLPVNQNELVGQLIYVSGTSTDSGGANVQGGAITAISINPTTGVGTISYDKTATNQSTTADSGKAIIRSSDIGEVLVSGTSQVFAIQEGSGGATNQLAVTFSASFPSAPGAVTLTLQASLANIDSQYSDLTTITNVNGDTQTISGTRFLFLRVVASGVSGGSSPTVVAKILI